MGSRLGGADNNPGGGWDPVVIRPRSSDRAPDDMEAAAQGKQVAEAVLDLEAQFRATGSGEWE
jgi:hypothetical protein